MSTKSKSKTDTKAKKTDATAAKPEASKSESPKADAASSSEASGGGTKSSAPSREISYFSSVSTDDYRAGWNDIFSSGESEPRQETARKPAKRKAASKLPATITLELDDLDPSTREQLEGLFRRQAKKKRLNYAKASREGQVSWQLSCHISGP